MKDRRRAYLSAIRVRSRGSRIVLALLLAASSALALGPHELLILANRNSTNSTAIAAEYARWRQVPDCNVVLLDLPAGGGIEISSNDFTRLIWGPAWQAVKERGLEDHILAWAYSVDFPTRIKVDPAVSIQGLTFLRNRLPPTADDVAKALYVSPLFAGPERPRDPGFPSRSLDSAGNWQGKDAPLPSMMLGFMGPNGNTREEIAACLQRGLRSDGAAPEGKIYFATNTDVRARCREWEFPSAVKELHGMGVQALITNALPDEGEAILGIMAGAADIDMGPKREFVPGAMAEHLTSFGAMFEGGGQTKITEWIRAGATASAGTVTEPMALWPKFPHARFYVHLAAGCTMLESFYQSIRCPLQILTIGDPLAAPWAPASQVNLRGLEKELVRGRVSVTAVVQARHGEWFNRFLFLLDGKTLGPAGRDPTVTIETAALAPGRHTVRAVAYRVGTVRSQIFAERSFTVEGK